MPPPPQRFSFDPIDPSVGTKLTICYDFGAAPAATSPVAVMIDYGVGSATQANLTADDNCVTVTVPAGCEDIVAHDTTGQSADGSVVVH